MTTIMNEDQYETLAEYLMVKGQGSVALPISHIDGVRVDCSITLRFNKPPPYTVGRINETYLRLEIQNPYRVKGDEYMLNEVIKLSPHCEISDDKGLGQIAGLIKETFAKISVMKYDRNASGTGSEFSTKDIIARDIMVDIFSNIPNTRVVGEKCCVCLCQTTSLTECNHALCLQCWAKLPQVEDADGDDEVGHKCPMCRGFMEIVF